MDTQGIVVASPHQNGTRPKQDDYYMFLAEAVSSRANCRGRRVGAILVLGNRIISTGYNGTPEDMPNCDEGGCYRCKHRGTKFLSGEDLDICICVHAEQNALLSAARFGIAVEGAWMYTTDQPCFTCAKELLQAKVTRVYYRHPSPRPADESLEAERLAHFRELDDQYKRIQTRLLIAQHLPAPTQEPSNGHA